jgi:hypothetical protein
MVRLRGQQSNTGAAKAPESISYMIDGPVRLPTARGSTRSEMRATFSSVSRDPMESGRANEDETKRRGKKRCTDCLGDLYHVFTSLVRFWRYFFRSAVYGPLSEWQNTKW